MTVLVTGAQGFLGRYVVACVAACAPDMRIIGVGRSPRDDSQFTHDVTIGSHPIRAAVPQSVRQSILQAGYEYRQLDVLDVSALTDCLCETRVEIIIHLAAALRDSDEQELLHLNIEGTRSLLSAIRNSNSLVQRLVLGSSGGVYGRVAPSDLPLSEDRVCAPVDPYSRSKLAAEELAQTMAAPMGLELIIGRLFNLIGPGQDERHVTSRLASQLNAIAHCGAPPVILLGALHPTRDFIDVRDAAAALWLLAAHQPSCGIINVASGIETSIRALCEMFVCASGLKDRVQLIHEDPRPNDTARHVADVSRLSALGFQPRQTLRASVNAVLEWYESQTSAGMNPATGEEVHSAAANCSM